MPLKLSFFSCKDTLTKSFQSYVVCQVTFAGCKACYIGETKHNLNKQIEEYLGNYKNLIYSDLQENSQCEEKVNFDRFEIIDGASS